MNYYCIPGLRRRNEDAVLQVKYQLKSEEIIDIVTKYYDTTLEELQRKSRWTKRVEARQMIFYFLREYTKMTLTQIAKLFNQDHTTVRAGLISFKNQLDTDEKIREKIKLIDSKI